MKTKKNRPKRYDDNLVKSYDVNSARNILGGIAVDGDWDSGADTAIARYPTVPQNEPKALVAYLKNLV